MKYATKTQQDLLYPLIELTKQLSPNCMAYSIKL